jgi:hypothetical protein
MTPANFASWLKYQENAINNANNQVLSLRQSLTSNGNLSAGT